MGWIIHAYDLTKDKRKTNEGFFGDKDGNAFATEGEAYQAIPLSPYGRSRDKQDVVFLGPYV